MVPKPDNVSPEVPDRSQLHSQDRRDGNSFFRRHRDKMTRDGLVALVVGVILAVIAALLASWFQDQHFKRQEVLENTRFARQLSLTDGRKPLSGLNLREAELSSLNLAGANLARADLRGADLKWVVLIENVLDDETDYTVEARLALANLTEADLTGANLTGADLTGADLTNAILAGANLTGADLTDTALTGVRFERDFEDETISGVCYSSSTVWPEGYEIKEEPRCK